MLAKIEKEPLGVMDMGSDEEDCTVVDKGNSSNKTPLQSKLQTPEQQQKHSSIEATTTPIVPEDDFRSFWKAGSYAVEPTNKFAPAGELLEHARVHPKFLHSNATSHKWAFGAIAELLDNAVDEIPKGATFVKVDKIDLKKDNSPALVFHDDGGGMDPESLRKCMSLGYSSKKGSTTIGQYGNGFKTSTMRLGADVIVLSRANHGGKATQSVGLLSYTFLRTTGQDDVIVPMIDFDISSSWAEPIIYSSQDDWSSNLKTILEWSPFSSKDELMVQFEDIGNHGTKVIIYNLWLNDEGIYELSFDDDEEDIRLRDESSRGGSKKLNKKTVELQRHISYRIRYSLRAYASMLYLRKFTNFSIILRGVRVQQFNIADELKNSEVVTYKPQTAAASKEAVVETTIGFIKEAPTLGVCGFNIYHKNRLIRSFWKVVPEGSSRGHGVVGVLEANFIEPTHDKQDFERSSLFMRLETRLKQMVMDYWKTHCHLIGYQSPMDRALKIQNVGAVPPSRGNTQPVELCPDQKYGGLSASSLGSMRLDQAMVGHPAADVQNFNRAQYGRTNGADVQKDLPAGSYEVVLPMNDSEPLSVNQLCEDNVQLFMRCDEHKQRHTALKQMITRLEKELEEAKAKCSHLSSFMLLKGFQKQ